MADFSNFLENEILDAVFNAGSLASITPWVSLHTADPGETGSSEVTGGSYARQDGSSSFAAASSGSVSSDADISFTSMPAVTVTHVGIWDASSGGNFLFKGTLSASKSTNSGDTFTISSGDATFSAD